MMNTPSRPVSCIIKSKELEDEPKKRSREEWKKEKELEEMRKAGTAPAAVDEEGKDINPHIPQYISSAPWYINSEGPTLKHQRPQEEKQKSFSQISDYYKRGERGSTATRYRKGACENCGAITHKRKDCLERPRKVGAKFSGSDLAADEILLPNLNMDYDGKRDRWNGFDPEMYKVVVDEHEKVEEAKRQMKEEKLKQETINSEDKKDGEDNEDKEGDSDSDEDEDEKYADHIDMPGTKVDSKQRITVRNLRIREDTAKYLRNLDIDSAYYDPKTRSMRDNPYKNKGKTAEELNYAGDNFVRYSGDTQAVSNAQSFAWQAYEKGVDVHLQAEPTKAELLHKEFDVKKEEYKDNVKDNILSKYGGEEHLKVPPRELIFAQTDEYKEYNRHGNIVVGSGRVIIRSIYEEDVLINNHTSVWGSFWHQGKWGFKCCHSFIKNSYCVGEVGKAAILESNRILLESQPAISAGHDAEPADALRHEDDENVEEGSLRTKSLLEQHREKRKSKKEKKRKHSESNSEDEEAVAKEKLAKALKAEDENRRKAEEWLQMDERERKYNSMYESGTKEPTEEEMEAYRMRRTLEEDPMSHFLKNK